MLYRQSWNYETDFRIKILRKWIEDLRNGTYDQVRGKIEADGGVCVIGALLKSAGEDIYTIHLHPNYEKARELLAPSGIKDIHLIALNDGEHKSFAEIADWAEAVLNRRTSNAL